MKKGISYCFMILGILMMIGNWFGVFDFSHLKIHGFQQEAEIGMYVIGIVISIAGFLDLQAKRQGEEWL